MSNEYITLGKCSNFLFTILGSFLNDNGVTSKLQSDYINENIKTEFSKYKFESKSDSIMLLFYKTIFLNYKDVSNFSRYLLRFPSFLKKTIKTISPSFYELFSTKQIVTFLIIYYTAFHYGQASEFEQKYFLDFLQVHITNTYNDILKDTRINFSNISEKCKWSNLHAILDEIKTAEAYSNEKERIIDCQILIQHYLFLGIKKALKTVFDFSDNEVQNLEVMLVYKTDSISKNLFSFIREQKPDFYEDDIFSLVNEHNPLFWKMFYSPEQWENKNIQYSMTQMNAPLELLFSNIQDQAIEYFITSAAKISEKESENLLSKLEQLNNKYCNKVLIPWFKARKTIFSLTFTDKAKDKELKEQACKLFKEVFDNCKYFIGNNLPEFLSDAIACDVYCNPKKDIFDNAQDNTNESSIILPGKAYWEFGYAVDIFPEDSRKTYLLTFNAEDNFWTIFPLSKFQNQKGAKTLYDKETINSEFQLPVLLESFNNPDKIDNLGSAKRKDLRQPIGNRYYSNLSIYAMKANISKQSKSISDFKLIQNIIKNNETEKLFVNDENGANALIRSLERYRLLCYGFTDKDIIDRAKIILKYAKNEISFENFLNEIIPFENTIAATSQNTEETRNELKNTIKEMCILPLIKKAGNHIFDEALVLNERRCVSALELAIDCYDEEIVKAIIDNLPKDSKLSDIHISYEYLTPLQYAIRKYDYLMQYSQMLFSKNTEQTVLEKRQIFIRKNTDKGILEEDQDFYHKNNKIFRFIDDYPAEECGLYLEPIAEGNVLSSQQKKLLNIIKMLAEKTEPISVDTFYYLADIIDPEDGRVFQDIFDITKILIDTGHADLCGTNFEWNRSPWEPHQTLLAYCINHSKKNEEGTPNATQKNYGMLNFLLTNYPEQFEPIINERIQAPDSNGNIRYDTDLHFFVSNQIDSIKLYNQNKDEDYGKQIAGRMSYFLKLFIKAGARLDIPDHNDKTVLDYLREWKDKMPQGCIPEEIVL